VPSAVPKNERPLGGNPNASRIFAAMGRKNLLKLEEFSTSPNCIFGKEGLAGTWHDRFGNQNPIILELGCGKGDLALGLARRHPDVNYIGVDLKGVRMRTGALAALKEGLHNVLFLRADIHGVSHFFAPNEVAGLWITFPDPFPRLKNSKNRMINEKFLKNYVQMLPAGGDVWFKTDNITLFDYTLSHFAELNDKQVFKIEIVEMTRDLHASALRNDDNGITTDYERRFLAMGKPTNYMHFRLSAGPNVGMVPACERVALDSDERAPRVR
jgi:tRNA (guanine-N7-)-methyltransferase